MIYEKQTKVLTKVLNQSMQVRYELSYVLVTKKLSIWNTFYSPNCKKQKLNKRDRKLSNPKTKASPRALDEEEYGVVEGREWVAKLCSFLK